MEGRHGLYIKAQPNSLPSSIALDATIRNTIRHTGSLSVTPDHLMEKIRIGRAESLFIILLDASSSMRMNRKIQFAKSLAWAVLKRSYEKRCHVALMAFRGDAASLVAGPTGSIIAVEDALAHLPAGGTTPLTPALRDAALLAKKEGKSSVLVVVSDGRGNVFIGGSLEEDVRLMEKELAASRIIFVNAETRSRILGILETLSARLGAEHFYLDDLL